MSLSIMLQGFVILYLPLGINAHVRCLPLAGSATDNRPVITLQDRGVLKSDGDGTVPIISTGLMCYKGWRTKRLNPANIPVVSREYVHQPSTAFKDLR